MKLKFSNYKKPVPTASAAVNTGHIILLLFFVYEIITISSTASLSHSHIPVCQEVQTYSFYSSQLQAG